MTHAFFKALLFMAAGSVIGAMAGEQSLNRMGGFRKVMPITYACFIIGGLALSGMPPFSGFFSKDDILLGIGELGGWHWILYVGGYIGALMTAIYTFRMIFRAFHGDPCEEAKSLEAGRLYHAPEHRNPADGTLEDTGVGFPGSKHHIAERSVAMTIAMGVLAFLATTAGVLQIPKISHVMENFLEPTFVGAEHFGVDIDVPLLLFGMGLGTVLGLLGIWIAWTLYVKRPGSAAAIEARFAGAHKLFANKWYFDEAIDFAIVRPFAALGRFAQRTVERVVVDGGITGGPVSIARVSSAAVRSWQSGLLRAYAAAVTFGAALVLLYFLLQG
jgi:NADH-quinone oxidoreductase subunit L